MDLDAVADPSDKIAECQFFLALAERESDAQRFRWLVSAFFGAAYSFFEINALRVFHSFWDPRTGEPIENSEALEVLRRYVTVLQNVKKPTFIKTGGNHRLTQELYELRRGSTHHYPLSIMATSSTLPEGFHFGSLKGKGTPALPFCREAMALIEEAERELQKHF